MLPEFALVRMIACARGSLQDDFQDGTNGLVEQQGISAETEI